MSETDNGFKIEVLEEHTHKVIARIEVKEGIEVWRATGQGRLNFRWPEMHGDLVLSTFGTLFYHPVWWEKITTNEFNRQKGKPALESSIGDSIPPGANCDVAREIRLRYRGND